MVMTWDTKEKSYKAYVFGNDFPGSDGGDGGSFEGRHASFYRAEFQAEGRDAKIAKCYRGSLAPETLVSEEFMAMKDGTGNFTRCEWKQKKR